MKIAVSGCAGIGKSTLAREIARQLDVACIPESYETIFNLDKKSNNTLEFHTKAFNAVLDFKLAEQKRLGRFVVDRSPADLLNLWIRMARGFRAHDATNLFYTRCQQAMLEYDLIVIPPIGVIPLRPTEDPFQKQKRNLNPWVRMINQASIIGLTQMMTDTRRILHLPPVQAEPAELAARVIQQIGAI